ncbi:adenylate/guanylate cyclase domain-containing protein (plasmid) [Bradyrhizobium sp. CB82]|uniref:adenylate/guanylate cyclase domain-containing protein n=1 Tax=Bradyrhizobium sp. CB82 TaxID=3039159 RepID=UPI0024B0474E|nr:adenylate/guanylate cyclase domain-containing protein [Bradyrhizobium sp. CB82]WFU45444.1 adenylate/guanylate cyclase domain-containing protein [Bradyrhizobium sp. CB82]
MVQERPVRVERRLSAIVAADVAGYSRMMHHDEETTHAKLTILLADVVTPAISEHGGRIVKNTGDGFLAEFPSAVGAVRAALQFQTRVKEFTTTDAGDARIAFRVGINVGDVIVEPHDIFGDDVNIAARLESIAEPGGICISSSAHDHIHGKISIQFVDLGEQVLKNIDRPIRAYVVVRDEHSPTTLGGRAKESPTSPPRLSLVVLPFANLGGDPKQDYFPDGVTESLTTDLSRISGSFVIGRHTAFTYKGKAVDLKKIGRELNIRYVLEGSVQRSDDRLRVNVQLVDTETGAHLWADRFDKPIADLFDMQDEIVARLANALNAELIAAEARRAERSVNPDAMDLYFQGIAFANRGTTPEYMTRVRGFFERALTLDPFCVEALVGAATVDETIASALLTDDDPGPRLAAAEATLNKALSLAPQHASAHLVLGIIEILTNRAAQGIAECERALALDRNLAHAHAWIGLAKMFVGRAAETETHVREALRLSPRDTRSYIWLLIAGLAKLHLSAEGEAVAWLRRSIEANRNHPLGQLWLAAALARLGRLDEAKAAARAALALNPSFTIRRVRANVPSDNPTYLAGRERIYADLRLAGVPEE